MCDQLDVPHIRWIPPPMGWIKANSDGAVSGTSKMAACGGLLRDPDGRWRGGIAKKIGICGVLQAELWGICEILQLAWRAGFRYIQLEIDSKIVADLISKGTNNSCHRGGGGLLSFIFEWIRKDWVVSVRESNRAADVLAGIGLFQPMEYSAPAETHLVMFEDL